jgi:hypothetical protein
MFCGLRYLQILTLDPRRSDFCPLLSSGAGESTRNG